MISYDGNSSSSEPKNPKQKLSYVTQALTDFSPSTRFDRKLILGIMFRQGKIPDDFLVPTPKLQTDEND